MGHRKTMAMLVSHNQRVTCLNTQFYIFPKISPWKIDVAVFPNSSAEKGLCKVASLVVQNQVAEDVCTSKHQGKKQQMKSWRSALKIVPGWWYLMILMGF